MSFKYFMIYPQEFLRDKEIDSNTQQEFVFSDFIHKAADSINQGLTT